MPSSEPDAQGGSQSKPPKWRDFERLAADFLSQQGFDILERNWRTGHLEIDLVVRRPGLLVFVEVKSASSQRFGHPAEKVDSRKTERLTRAARAYLIEKEIEGYDLRFDVITFVDGRLEHFPGAFDASE